MTVVRWVDVPPEGDLVHQSFYQSSSYARFLEKDGRRPLWLVAHDDDGVVGRWLLLEQSTRYPFRERGRLAGLLGNVVLANHSPAVRRGASLEVRSGIWKKMLEFISHDRVCSRAEKITLRLDPVIPEAEIGVWQELAAQYGFLPEATWSYVSALAPTSAEMFSLIKSDRRTKVRKAEKEGLEFQVSFGEAALREYFEVRCETARRNGLPAPPWSHFAAGHELYSREGAGRVFTVRSQARVAAAQLAVRHEGFVTLSGVSVADWAHDAGSPANDLLQWRIIEWAIESGAKQIDYVGAQPQSTDPKAQAIDRFKSRWGTSLRQSVTLTRQGSVVRRLARRLCDKLGV